MSCQQQSLNKKLTIKLYKKKHKFNQEKWYPWSETYVYNSFMVAQLNRQTSTSQVKLRYKYITVTNSFEWKTHKYTVFSFIQVPRVQFQRLQRVKYLCNQFIHVVVFWVMTPCSDVGYQH
jgi:hypothetical protein